MVLEMVGEGHDFSCAARVAQIKGFSPEVMNSSTSTLMNETTSKIVIDIVHAESADQIALARELFLEYAESLGFNLCFQGFDKELAALPGD